MKNLFQDFRYGLRMLGRSPGFSLLAIFVLAFGIGSTTLVFSVVDTVVFRPLPYQEPDQLVLLDVRWSEGTLPGALSGDDFDALTQQPGLFESLAAFWSVDSILQTNEGPVEVRGQAVTASFFETLGVRPFAGRTLIEEDAALDAEPAAVVSYAFWQTRLGGDPGVLGRVVNLSGTPYSIIGILPPDFQPPHFWGTKAEVWTPLEPTERFREGRYGINVLARIAGGRPPDEVQAYLATVHARMPSLAEHPDARVASKTVFDDLVGGEQFNLVVLLGAVSFVLLLACANLAHLLLARVPARQSEIAVRVALGARAFQLVRQLWVESALLAIGGGAFGLLLAWWALPVVIGLAPAGIPRIDEVAIDPRVVLFTLGLSLATATGFGLGPAFVSAAQPLRALLSRSGVVGSPDRRFQRFRGALIVSELALSMMLLAGAGLLLRTFLLTRPVDLGFNPSQKIIGLAQAPRDAFESPEKQLSYYRQGLERIGGVLGVSDVAAASFLPLPRVHSPAPFAEEGSIRASRNAYVTHISPNFLRVMEIPLVAGRPFAETDDEGSPKVVIVNETLARMMWPGELAVGRMLKFGRGLDEVPAHRIVGVVADARSVSMDVEIRPTIYAAFAQNPYRRVNFVVKTLAPPEQVARSVREAMLRVEPAYPVVTREMEHSIWQDRNIVARRFRAWLLGVLAAIALLLALLGVFGSVAHGVRQRTREIGLRVALGAESGDVVRLFLKRGLRLVALGLAAGLAGSAALTRLLESQLVGVTPLDPLTFAAVAALLGATGFAAVYLPARRATRVDPMEALRYE